MDNQIKTLSDKVNSLEVVAERLLLMQEHTTQNVQTLVDDIKELTDQTPKLAVLERDVEHLKQVHTRQIKVFYTLGTGILLATLSVLFHVKI